MGRSDRILRRSTSSWSRRDPDVPQSRALLVGVSRTGPDVPPSETLRSFEDVGLIRSLLIEKGGYREEDIVVMTDAPDTPTYLHPTQMRLRRQMKMLVKGARRGDRHFFFYAGHGVQIPCEEGSSESDGLDECIVCADGSSLRDNYLKETLVDSLPPGASLFALFDACHAGTMLDLPHRICNRSYSVGMALHGILRMTRSILSLPTEVSSLSTPRTSPAISTIELPPTPSASPMLLPELVTSPTSLVPPSPMSPSLLFSPLPQSMDMLSPMTQLIPPPLSPMSLFSELSLDPSPLHTPSSVGGPLEPLSLDISADFKPTTEYASEPVSKRSDTRCTGSCSPIDDEGPYIVSLAATADDEISWEDSFGGPLTKAFIAVIRNAEDHLTIGDLMMRLRDRFADLQQERYVAFDKWKRELLQRGEALPDEDYEPECCRPQRPQLSSWLPLDKRDYFRF